MAKKKERKPGTPNSKEKAVIDASKTKRNPRIAMKSGRIPETPEVGNGNGPSENRPPLPTVSPEPEMFTEVPTGANGEPDIAAAKVTPEWKRWATSEKSDTAPIDPIATAVSTTGYAPRSPAVTPSSTSGAKADERAAAKAKKDAEKVSNTPSVAADLLTSGSFGDSGVKGSTEGQTGAFQDIYEERKQAAATSAIQDYADMFGGYFDQSPEAKANHNEEMAKRVLEHRRVQEQAKTGKSAMINAVLNGIGKYKDLGGNAPLGVAKDDKAPKINTTLANENSQEAIDENAINREMNRSKGAHDPTQFGAGSLPNELTPRNVTPYASKHWLATLKDQVETFKSMRRGVRVFAKAEGVVKAHANHDSRFPTGDRGVVQCDSPACIKGQSEIINAAAKAKSSPELLEHLLHLNFEDNHKEEATRAGEINADLECKKRGLRMDESATDYQQPSHTEAECPFVHPETGKKLTLINDRGQPYICNNHLGDLDRNGKPKESDLSTFPLGLTYTTSTTAKHGNKLPRTVQIQMPGLEDYLKTHKYREIENEQNLLTMLHDHARKNPDIIDSSYLDSLDKSALSKAIDTHLGNKSAELRFDKEVNRGKHMGPILEMGATSYRAPGYENMENFGSHNNAKKKFIAGAVAAGMAYYKQNKTLSNDVQDIVDNATDPKKSMGSAAERVGLTNAKWEDQAEGLLRAHANRAARIRVSRSAGQFYSPNTVASRLMHPIDAGFAAEGRERSDGRTRFQDRLSQSVLDAGNAIAEASGTITEDTRSVVPPAAAGGNRSSGVTNSMPASQPRRDPATVEQEPEPTMTSYSSTSAPVAPQPTVKSNKKTQKDMDNYAAKKKAQRKAAKNTTPPDVTLQ
jgi:hypothetical protein